MTSEQGQLLCRCGHDRAAHEHYRRGHDCGACGAAGCGEFHSVAADAGEVVTFPRRRLSRLRWHAGLPSVANDAPVTSLPLPMQPSAGVVDPSTHELSG